VLAPGVCACGGHARLGWSKSRALAAWALGWHSKPGPADDGSGRPAGRCMVRAATELVRRRAHTARPIVPYVSPAAPCAPVCVLCDCEAVSGDDGLGWLSVSGERGTGGWLGFLERPKARVRVGLSIPCMDDEEGRNERCSVQLSDSPERR